MLNLKNPRKPFKKNIYSCISHFTKETASFYLSIGTAILETFIRFQGSRSIVHKLSSIFLNDICDLLYRNHPSDELLFLIKLIQSTSNLYQDNDSLPKIYQMFHRTDNLIINAVPISITEGLTSLNQCLETSLSTVKAIENMIKSLIHLILNPLYSKNQLKVSSQFPNILNTLSNHYSLKIILLKTDGNLIEFCPSQTCQVPVIHLYEDHKRFSVLYTEEMIEFERNPSNLSLLQSPNTTANIHYIQLQLKNPVPSQLRAEEQKKNVNLSPKEKAKK